MFNLSGSISFTSNMDLLQSAMYDPTCRIVAMMDNLDTIVHLVPNAAPASILLPPYSAVSAFLDGNKQVFFNEYFMHLGSKEADAFICVMLAASARGINILLYVPKDEAENLGFVGAFSQYMFNAYGVCIGNDNGAPFNFNPNFTVNLLCRLYMHDLISYQELLVEYPPNTLIADYIIPKLAFELKFIGQPHEVVQQLNAYLQRIKQNNNTFLQRAVIRTK